MLATLVASLAPLGSWQLGGVARPPSVQRSPPLKMMPIGVPKVSPATPTIQHRNQESHAVVLAVQVAYRVPGAETADWVSALR